jgi:glycine cleavage system aminomethyltransferase T
MRERVTEIVSYCVEMHDVDADCASARNIRTSPLHALLDERCAQFQSIVAWERPAYFGDTRKLSFSEIVQNEIANSMTKHLCIDRSTDCKIELSGSGTMQAWHKLAPGVSLPPPWRPKTFPIINSFGGVDAIVTVLQCSTD